MKPTCFIPYLLLTLWIGCFGAGCRSVETYAEQPAYPFTDSVKVVFTQFLSTLPSSEQSPEEWLVKTISNDSTITFNYRIDSVIIRSLTVWYRSNVFGDQQVSAPKHRDLILTDQVNLTTSERDYHFGKYEIAEPAIDGAGCYIIEAQDGVIAIVSYNWPQNSILTTIGKDNDLSYASMLIGGPLSYQMKHNK